MDWPLLTVTVSLCLLGLVTLYSAAGSPLIEGSPRVFRMQALFMALGFVLMGTMTLIDPRFYERMAYVVFGAVLVLLVIVGVTGLIRGGAQRWIPIGPFHLQPSELAKLAMVLALARFFAHRPKEQGWGLANLAVPMGIFLLPMAFLIFKEPDLGTSLFLLFVFAVMSFAVGLRWRTMAVVGLVAVLATPIAYKFLLDDYQRERIDVVLRPDADPRGKGYQTIQGRYAIGSGQFFGKGWGEGTQGRLRFLPEQHTDFIFSVYAEEQGFVGCVLALSLYFGQMLLGLWIAWNARDRFGSILAIGVVAVLFCQVFINLGGVLGLLPVTGVTLPFMSYGGSSVLTLLGGVGMLMSVSVRRRS
jgi:rod shape determining protein RodA